ncbi:MAG TPA: TIGR03790 family protein, partial [Polyangiaceae bacterium]
MHRSRTFERYASLSLILAAALIGAACSSGNGATGGGGGTPNANGGASTAGAAPSGGASGGPASSGAAGMFSAGGAGGGNVIGGSGGGSSAGSGGVVQQGGSGGSAGSAGSGPAPQRPKRTADEVLVVANANSPTSMAIAQDYAAKRNVQNVLSINCADSATSSDKETIELSDYTSSIATPIQQFLLAHSSVNFVVLTKGIPIRINGAKTGCCQGNVDNKPNGSGQPSVDSYLAAIDYPQIADAKKINITGSGTVGSGWLNRYWNASEPFTHAKFGGYIVTRLDGFTEADAKSLVTRALAAEQTAATSTNKVLLDVDAPRGLGNQATEPAPVTQNVSSEWSYDTWNADLLNAGDLLQASGVPNMVDKTDTYVGNQSNLLG